MPSVFHDVFEDAGREDFACSRQRDDPGANASSGFTHKIGDIVSIRAHEIGALVNEVVTCDQAEPWTFGAGALMANLARRGLLAGR
jgi:fumarylacetoacetate (FAA) hydrolase family protein